MPHVHIAASQDALAPLVELHADPPRFSGDLKSGYTIKSYLPGIRCPLHGWASTPDEARRMFFNLTGEKVEELPTPPPGRQPKPCGNRKATKRKLTANQRRKKAK